MLQGRLQSLWAIMGNHGLLNTNTNTATTITPSMQPPNTDPSESKSSESKPKPPSPSKKKKKDNKKKKDKKRKDKNKKNKNKKDKSKKKRKDKKKPKKEEEKKDDDNDDQKRNEDPNVTTSPGSGQATIGHYLKYIIVQSMFNGDISASTLKKIGMYLYPVSFLLIFALYLCPASNIQYHHLTNPYLIL